MKDEVDGVLNWVGEFRLEWMGNDKLIVLYKVREMGDVCMGWDDMRVIREGWGIVRWIGG